MSVEAEVTPHRPALYLTTEDVKAIYSYGHWIPLGNGGTRAFLAKRCPGWSWNQIIVPLREADLLRTTPENVGGLVPGCIGVVLSEAGVIPDDGTLLHPLKTARLEETAKSASPTTNEEDER
jgi:hypothetical protein